jgi:4-amino-4-deoxy-L-arabinose transferase-like glycosyltransferase
VWPVLLIHVLLLTLGVVAVAGAATILLPRAAMFESVTFSLDSLAMLAVVLACARGQPWLFIMAGVGFGLLCLTRVSFLVAALIVPVLIALDARFKRRPSRGGALWFAVAFLVIMLPWAARNAISVGKFGITEEYGAVTLVERFAYNRMTPREFMLAFPYCLPEIGHPLVGSAFGADVMDRFQYDLPDSFYAIGREQRDALTAKYGRVDTIIGAVTRDELRENWWRHLLTSVPLAWCGMWVGGWLGLLLVPIFAACAVIAWRRGTPPLQPRSDRPILHRGGGSGHQAEPIA